MKGIDGRGATDGSGPDGNPLKETREYGHNPDRWDRRAGLQAAGHARSVALTERPERKARDPRLLSGGLEPGLRRPDGALQRDPSRLPRARRRAPGDFRG